MLLKYKKLGDNFSLDEYNAITYLLKDNVRSLSETILLTSEGFVGKYGKYFFDYNENHLSMKPDSMIVLDNTGYVILKIDSDFTKFSKYSNKNWIEEHVESLVPENIVTCTNTLKNTEGFIPNNTRSSIESSTEWSFIGDSSLKVTTNGTSNMEGVGLNTIPVIEGETYSIQVVLHGKITQGRIKGIWRDSNNAVLGEMSYNTPSHPTQLEKDTVMYHLSGTAPPNATTLQYYVTTGTLPSYEKTTFYIGYCLPIKGEFPTFKNIEGYPAPNEGVFIENNQRYIKIPLSNIQNNLEIPNTLSINITFNDHEIYEFIDSSLVSNFVDLESAIINAQEGEVITLASTLSSPLNHNIVINKKITIKGSVANSIVDDSSHISTSGLFNITSTGELTLEQLTIKGYTNTSNGGAININEGTLNCLNCKFDTCTSNVKGGAINNTGGELYLTNTEFTNCTSPNGGAVYNGEV